MFPALLAKTNFGLDHATLADVAAILCEDEACLAPIANAANETTGEPRWIAVALIHALWRKAGVAPQVMSSVLKAWPEIDEISFIEFPPSSTGEGKGGGG